MSAAPSDSVDVTESSDRHSSTNLSVEASDEQENAHEDSVHQALVVEESEDFFADVPQISSRKFSFVPNVSKEAGGIYVNEEQIKANISAVARQSVLHELHQVADAAAEDEDGGRPSQKNNAPTQQHVTTVDRIMNSANAKKRGLSYLQNLREKAANGEDLKRAGEVHKSMTGTSVFYYSSAQQKLELIFILNVMFRRSETARRRSVHYWMEN
jgi:hypothetical protein